VLLDVDVPVALMALHVAAEQSGFDVSRHHTVFSGTCPGCKSREVEKTRSRDGVGRKASR
jgi:Fe2+ or Zn2+ uptake regulation protein